MKAAITRNETGLALGFNNHAWLLNVYGEE